MHHVLVAWILSVSVVSTTAADPTINVRLAFEDGLQIVTRTVPEGMSPVEAAVRAVVDGPTAGEAALGLYSHLPPGTQVVKLAIEGESVAIDLSPDVLVGLHEHELKDIFQQFAVTLGDFEGLTEIRLTCMGRLLSDYLPPVEPVAVDPLALQQVELEAAQPESGAALSGRSITLGPSHGRYWHATWGWLWQRGDPCGLGLAVLEDTNSIRLMQFLRQYLVQDGATVHVARQLDESHCCHSAENRPWWHMASYAWLRSQGLPCSVYASSSGICGSDTGSVTRLSDDIRARPLFADNRGSHIYISHHTNAGGGTGTETFRDSAMEHQQHVAASLNLANNVQGSIIDAIRDMWDSGWVNRGVKNSAGGFGEIRIPNQPAILIELAFHDHCTNDGPALTDNYFRSVAQWGIYRGICQYFGVTPTWDKYSDELAGNTIPDTMTAGQNYNVSVTFRNRGVLWRNDRNFRLGAVGDSDPFTPFNRVNIVGEVRPGQSYTFNFQMTAPASAGSYQTQWRMVRDGVTWFGPTLSKTVQVESDIPDDEPPTTPTNLTAVATGPGSVQLNWTASTDNVGVTGYDVRRNAAIIATVPGNSHTDNTVAPNAHYVYEVRARDAAGNVSGWSDPADATTPPGSVLVFSDGFDGSLNNWTTGAQAFTYSTTANHGTFPGAGAAFAPAGSSSQMHHDFPRPFAQGTVSGWFLDGNGGWRPGICGSQYRQALSLRAPGGVPDFFIDNAFNQAVGNADYFYRKLGGGGSGTYFPYAQRDPNAPCSGVWVYFQTTVTPNEVGAGSTGEIQLLVTDGAGTTVATTPLTTDFFSFGIGRITLGLGVSSHHEGYWDDVAFEAFPPTAPDMGAPTGITTGQITWHFTFPDGNLFGVEVADEGGSLKSPIYPGSGWLNRSATSWTETSLAANSSNTRKVRGWNGTLNGLYSDTATAWTLSVPPTAESVTADVAEGCVNQPVAWTAVGGFGPGTVQYYRYAWTQNPSHSFTGGEPVWSSDTLDISPSSVGDWYLHVRGYNGADVPNGTFSYKLPVRDCTCNTPWADADGDGDVDQDDFAIWQRCLSDSEEGFPSVPEYYCGCFDRNGDGRIDEEDFDAFLACVSGPTMPANPLCPE